MSTDHDRDQALAALWREHSTETPPAHVDAAILAAAHRAVGSGPRDRHRWPAARAWRWWMPLAAAAMFGVVIVGVKPPSQIVLDDAAQTATDVPAAPAPEPGPTAPARKDSAAAPAEERAKTVEAPRQTPQLEEKRPQTFATPPAGAAAAGSSATPAQRASPAIREDTAALQPDAFVARIRALRDEGRQDDASRELTRFRAAFADADVRLPADLREWAKTVR